MGDNPIAVNKYYYYYYFYYKSTGLSEERTVTNLLDIDDAFKFRPVVHTWHHIFVTCSIRRDDHNDGGSRFV